MLKSDYLLCNQRKTAKPFRHDLSKSLRIIQWRLRNRFKGLDLIDRVPEELWMEVCNSLGVSGQKHPKEKEMHEGIVVS